MTTRTRPPFRADHVGSFLRPQAPARGARTARRAARSRAEHCARSRTTRSPRSSSSRRTSACRRHRRRIPPHLLPHRLPRAARRRQDRHPGDDQEARRHRGARAAGDARDRQGAPREGHPARRLPVPEVRRARPHAEGDHPVADDAALPRRPRRHQQRALSRARAVLRGRRQRLRRRAALARRSRLHLRADGRHQPRLPLRRQDARGRARARRRPRRAAAPLRQRSSTASWRRSPPA